MLNKYAASLNPRGTSVLRCCSKSPFCNIMAGRCKDEILRLFVMSSAISLPVEATVALCCSNILKFSQPCRGRNVPKGSAKGQMGDMECERGKERMSGAEVEEEIRGKINVIRTRELY